MEDGLFLLRAACLSSRAACSSGRRPPALLCDFPLPRAMELYTHTRICIYVYIDPMALRHIFNTFSIYLKHKTRRAGREGGG